MLNMGSFLERFSRMRQGEGMEMLFMLFDAYQRSTEGAKEGLPEFLQWAPATLRDMSEVDSHLLDLGQLYRDLRQFHEIEEWSFRLGDLSEGQERLAHHWLATGRLHRQMHEMMAEHGVGTTGYLARKGAEQAGELAAGLPWQHVWFAGLNAVDPATTRIIQSLMELGKAQVAWDADLYYLEDPAQEAGRFLRRSIKDLGAGTIPAVDMLRQHPRRWHLTTVPNSVAQTRAAAQVLAALPEEEREGTAVVLASEDLLMPLLEALPPDGGPYNITMGMPLKALPVHGLVEAYLDLQDRHISGLGYHHADVERLLLHPFLQSAGRTPAIIQAIRKEQLGRLKFQDLLNILRSHGYAIAAAEAALEPTEGELARSQKGILHLLEWAREMVQADAFANEQLFRMARLQYRLDQGLQRYGRGQRLDIRSYSALRTRLFREEQIGFFGEPLGGVQIMGFLETRAIDHKRVIVLGANDGTLPSTSTPQSWIPFEIRRAYKLPLPGDPEAITAYHFHRLMHLCDEAHLVHDTSGDNGSAGPSRFIEQWKLELIPNSATVLHERTLVPPFPKRNAPPVAIRKDAHVLRKLQEWGQSGLSPSALGSWLTCPLDVYFRYVLGVKQQEEVDEKLGSDVLGAAVHRVLESIYRPIIGRPIRSEELQELAGQIHEALTRDLSTIFPSETLRVGSFRLRIEMAAKAMAAYLAAEAHRCRSGSTIPLSIEEVFEAPLPNGIHIKGRCDRVEERDGIVHILDLKTGNVQPWQAELKGLEREHLSADKRYALQLLIYAWTYLHQHPEVSVVRAGIIPMQRASQAEGILLKVAGSHDIGRGMMAGISDLLTTLVEEIMDPGAPFSHHTDSLYCGCCVG